MLDLSQCRDLTFDIHETSYAKLAGHEPASAAREIYVGVEFKEEQKARPVYDPDPDEWLGIHYHDPGDIERYVPPITVCRQLGWVELTIFDMYLAAANGVSAAEMVEAHSEEAAVVFGALFQGDLQKMAFEGTPFAFALRPSVMAASTAPSWSVPDEAARLVYFDQIYLEDLTEEETVLVLGRIIEMYTESMDIMALVWNPKVDGVKLAALKQLFTKLQKFDSGGLLFITWGGFTLPHHPDFHEGEED